MTGSRTTTPAGSPDPGLDPLVGRTDGLQPWRRVFHAACGIALAAALVVLDPSWAAATGALGILAAGLLLFDLLRLRIPRLNRLFFRLLRPFASPREALGVASSTWFILGAFLAVALFPLQVVVPALLVLALADPAASYAGRRWGRHSFGTGTFEGSLVFLAVAAVVLAPFTGVAVAAGVAVVVTAAERIPWSLDDNLVIPLLTGALLWSLLPFWG